MKRHHSRRLTFATSSNVRGRSSAQSKLIALSSVVYYCHDYDNDNHDSIKDIIRHIFIGTEFSNNNMNENKKKEFDKFRHEVYKFGLSGLEKKEQINARYEQAIKLGAKPKKWIKPPNDGPSKKAN